MCDIILQQLLHGVVLIEVDVFHVVEGERLTEHVLVEGAREVGVQQVAIVEGLADYTADELEEPQVIGVDERLR